MRTKFTAPVFEIKALEDTGLFSGYGAVFGNKDSYGDVIEPGAFKVSLAGHAARKSRPKMFWQHNMHEPIGSWSEMKEDNTGLWVAGKLNMDVQRGREAYSLLKAGDIDGLSIGYQTVKSEPDKKNGVLLLKELELIEVSVVSVGANDRALIDAVKATDEQVSSAANWLKKAIKLHNAHMDGSEPTSDASQMRMMEMMKKALNALVGDEGSGMDMGKSAFTVREFEEFLRDSGGFSKSNAVKMAIACAAHLLGEPEDDPIIAFWEAMRVDSY